VTVMPSAKPRSCCDESSCPRADIVRLIAPHDPIEDDVDALATAAAQGCPGLSRKNLEFCFTRTFELPGECLLFDRFCAEYDAQSQRLADQNSATSPRLRLRATAAGRNDG
jgi:hypothetical protein